MAAIPVESGSSVAQAIQSAVQPKLIENGWVVEETDTTLSEYVTTMITSGKDIQGVQSELGADLLGIGEDDPSVGEFARWLFEEVQKIVAPSQAQQPQQQPQEQQQEQQQQQQQQQQHPIQSTQDSQMDDASAPVGGAPTGPKSMRHGNAGRGRGGRMLGQLNRQMDRGQELPDSLRRIKGAAGGVAGRINAHANRDGLPRGPKNNNLVNGVQRMMNGGGRGGHAMNNPMMQMAGANMGQQQQMQLMQFMEMQTNMMMQMMQNGQAPNMNGGFKQGGGHRGGKQNNQSKGRQNQQPQQQHAVNGRLPDGPLQPAPNGDSGMEIDGQDGNSSRQDLFDTLCRFNVSCTNPNCGYAHQSPAAPAGTTVDLTDTCSFGVACANSKCSGRHPSPAQKNGGFKSDVDCKFYPNCTNPRCPFRHPTELPPCRNGADCTVPNCKFTHSKIMCRYNPCLNPSCAFKHNDGQKQGGFKDKVWTAEGGEESNEAGGTSERFAGFSQQHDGDEELIIPGRQNANGEQSEPQQQMQQQQQQQEVTVE